MVSKNTRKSKKNIEKYILIALILFYIMGIVLGCLFISRNAENKLFAEYLSRKNTYNTIVFFILAFFLKYSGILKTAVCMLPILSGINNSVYYYNLSDYNNSMSFSRALNILSNTSVMMLLILYCIVIILQIINRKYNIKRDVKCLFIYISATVTIYLLEYLLNIILF